MFSLTQAQLKKVEEWQKIQDAKVVEMQKKDEGLKSNAFVQFLLDDNVPYYGAAGGAYTYSFTPTGIGMGVTVSNCVTKEELDLTEYENW